MLLTKQHVTPSDPYELADRLYPKLAKQIRAALDALSSSSLEAIEIPESVQEALRNIYAQIAAATAQEAAPLVGVAFNSVNPRVVSWAERHVGNLITQITEESKQAIRDAITESLRQGLGAQPAARTLRPFLGLNGPQARALARFAGAFGEEPTLTQQRLIERRARRMLRQRAETVARTELITAANMGQQVTWDTAADEGLIPRSALKEWVAAEDDRTCPFCMAMDGVRVGYNDDYTVPTRFDSDGGVLNSVASKTPPAHPRCLPGDALVTTRGGILATTERIYRGDLVTLTTDQHRLRVTPNHPVLTTQGWVPAGKVQIGDQVISGVFDQRVASRYVDDYDVPTRIEEVVHSRSQSGTVTSLPVPVAAEDFHGDGEGSEVAVVSTDRLLMGNEDAALGEPLPEGELVGRGVRAPVGSDGVGYSVPFGVGLGASARRFVGGSDLRLSLCRTHLLPFQRFGSAPTANGNVALEESPSYRSPADAEAVGDSLLGFAADVSAHDVINVQVEPFHGPVFNLETTTGYYVADGIVVHNCRCAMILVNV